MSLDLSADSYLVMEKYFLIFNHWIVDYFFYLLIIFNFNFFQNNYILFLTQIYINQSF